MLLNQEKEIKYHYFSFDSFICLFTVNDENISRKMLQNLPLQN